jgi:hypothetical protein
MRIKAFYFRAERFKAWRDVFRRRPIGTMSRVQIITAVLLSIFLLALLTLRARYAPHENYFPGTAAPDNLTTSWVTSRNLLVAYEREQSKLRTAVIKQRKLYQDGEISKSEVVEAERAFVAVLARIQDVRRSMSETEIAIAETEMKDESSSTAMLSVDRFRQPDAPPAYRQGDLWSLKQARNIETYFYQTFGHNLPVSAFGQTATHDRMGFDHRDAMDVALHPDSAEGKALINHLRRSHIPYMAFRSAAARAATGAHIHIGRPSRRMATKLSYAH